MRKLVLVTFLLTGTLAWAQRHDVNPKERAAKHAENMKKELSLNDDQFAKVKAIDEKYFTDAMKLRSDTAQSVGTSRNRMKKLMDDHSAALKKVLTPEQWSKWTALRDKRREELKNGHHHVGEHGGEKKG